MRYRELASDFNGFTAELLTKAIDQHKLDELVSEDERAHLRQAMHSWGALNKDMAYTKGNTSSLRRGFEKPQGGGVDGAPVPSAPFARKDVMQSGLWNWMAFHERLDMQTTMFQLSLIHI